MPKQRKHPTPWVPDRFAIRMFGLLHQRRQRLRRRRIPPPEYRSQMTLFELHGEEVRDE